MIKFAYQVLHIADKIVYYFFMAFIYQNMIQSDIIIYFQFNRK